MRSQGYVEKRAGVRGQLIPVQTDAELVHAWRERAAELEEQARELRREGDAAGARDCEAAALDYRVDADRLEGWPS